MQRALAALDLADVDDLLAFELFAVLADLSLNADDGSTYARRALALQWLMLAVTDAARASTSLFLCSAILPDKSPANIAYFEEQTLRYLRVADARLAGREFLADELSVADFALYPLYAVRKALVDKAGDLRELTRWGAALAARPGVDKGMRAAD